MEIAIIALLTIQIVLLINTINRIERARKDFTMGLNAILSIEMKQEDTVKAQINLLEKLIDLLTGKPGKKCSGENT